MDYSNQGSYIELLAEAQEKSPRAQSALYVLDIIDTKSSGLLSYNGALTAGVFFYLGLISGPGVAPSRAALIFGILALAVVATAGGLALSCIFITGEHQKGMWIIRSIALTPKAPLDLKSLERKWIRLSYIRSVRYLWALYLTYLTGGLLFISLIFHYASRASLNG
jgi:hypothetical protein